MRPIWLSAHDSDCVIRRTVVFAYTSTETKVNSNFRRLQKAVSLFTRLRPFQQPEGPGPPHGDECSRELIKYLNNLNIK